MRISGARAVLISLGVGLAIGVVAGIAYALVFDKVLIYGIGTMLFITGVVVLVMALLGAVEPEQGWATGKGTQAEERNRRAMAARFSREHPALQEASSWALVVWGLAVGGPLLALSILAFTVAA